MFKTFSIIFVLVFSFNFIQGQSETTETGEEVSKEEKFYLEDSKTLLNLLGNIRDFRHLESDTTLQTEMKVKKIKELRTRLNQSLKGNSIHLKWAELKDVRPVEKIQLKPGEKMGMYQSEYTISDPNIQGFDGITLKSEKPKQNSSEGLIQVRISKFHPNKDTVLNLKKNNKSELSGKIRKFVYSGGHSTYYDSEGGPYEIIDIEIE